MKTRFCPSPTGFIHLGNARTALFNYLLAKRDQAVFLFRVEDTDRARFQPEFDLALQEDMQWLGLNWDEGPGIEDENSPYYQSQRQAIYDEYYERLESVGMAYPCFCSDEELALVRRLQQARGQPPRYNGACRHLSSEQIAEKRAQGLMPSLRFRVDEDQEVVFHDWVRGEQRFKTNDIGDFIIRRANGTASFMFCNAIDDALMGVTHALRGEDHLTNTPRQILILQALGLNPPHYGHISLIVAADGSPLSKRTGSRSIRELRENGYLPIAVNNYMARLGHYYSQEQFMSLDELAQHFNIDSLSRSPAKFNLQQLHYWQKEAVMRLDFLAFLEWVGKAHMGLVPESARAAFVDAVQPNVMFPEEVAAWASICFSDEALIVSAEDLVVLKATDLAYFDLAKHTYLQARGDYHAVIDALKNQFGLKGKALFQPLRLALTGLAHGPELAKFMALMPESLVINRLSRNFHAE
jgi:glutamyl-tRNA synthetase